MGHECVFASELRSDLKKLYAINYPGTRIEGDITKIKPEDIPNHDILCAGFPCQPFSQAGNQMGFEDEGRGNMFYVIRDILREKSPQYLFLENVANLKGHDDGRTWEIIEQELHDVGYDIDEIILSPHQFGIPQHRKRIYIVGIRQDMGGLNNFHFPVPTNTPCDIHDIIDENDNEYIPLKEDTRHYMEIWSEFVRLAAENHCKLPGFPIWAMEFGATYDYEDVPPCHQRPKQLKGKRGKLGRLIVGKSHKQMLAQLPVYAQDIRKEGEKFQDWKIRYIRQNREFYAANKSWIDTWIHNIQNFQNSHMKFEWNCGEDVTDIKDSLIQIRQSGIRAKRPTFYPSLVAMVNTPIIWDSKKQHYRKITPREAANLQSFHARYKFIGSDKTIYRQLGNSVNVRVLKILGENLFSLANKGWDGEEIGKNH